MSAQTVTVLGVPQTAPAFDVPANGCDCHVHVFGPADRFPFSADRVYTPGPASVDDLLSLQHALHLQRVQEAGVVRAVWARLHDHDALKMEGMLQR